jgi:CubicO group peptidase (beta-lactamase class C family)
MIRRLSTLALVIAALASGPAADAQTPKPSVSQAIATADSLVQAAVRDGTIPGADLVIAVDGNVLQNRAFGYAQLEDFAGQRLSSPRLMHESTMFDLASVTKVMATTFAMMILADQGKLNIDAPVYTYLPDFRGPHLDSITVRHLLTHTAGLVQWQPLYYQASNKDEAYRAIRGMPLQWGVGEGYHYSDLSFMLNGYIVEHITGQPLDAYLEKNLYQPLGLTHTVFTPRKHGFTEFAATEAGNGYEHHMVFDPNFGYLYKGDPNSWTGWRQYVDDGETNDGNSWYAHGGVAGHAGLFSTGGELRVLLDLLDNRGTYRGKRYISAAVIERFLAPGAHLGWQQPKDLPPTSFSHTGFTGTYVLGVPDVHLSLVLLTNRQNLGTNERGYFPDVAPLQAAVTRALMAALGK